MSKPPRIWISNAAPQKGELVRVRTQLEHPMESGLRPDGASGKIRPRHIVTRFEARLDGALLLAWEPGISVAQDPYIEFSFRAQASGELQLLWQDEAGARIEARKSVRLA